MNNLPLIVKASFWFIPVFSYFEGIEVYAGFDFICPKCNTKLKTQYQSFEIKDVKFCFNCGCEIDGKKAYEIYKQYKRIIYKNESKYSDILCESCGECGNRYICKKENIRMCDIIRENIRNNMDIITKVEPDADGRPNHFIVLNNRDNFEDLANGKK